MGTYGTPQHNGNISGKKARWPFPGTSAGDLLKTSYRIMVASDLLETTNFQTFYQEWIANLSPNEKKYIFVSSIELNGASVSSVFEEIKILEYSGCQDYCSVFQRIKIMGNWIFLTGDDSKAETVINASKEAGSYLRVYGLDQDGKLKNRRPLEYKSTPNVDAFSLPNQILPIRKVMRKNRLTPRKGDVVYTSKNQAVKLGNEFLSNPQSITYQTDLNRIQAKIYQAQWLTISYFEDKAKRMLEKPVRFEGICWPIDLLYNVDGEFIGILIPAAEGYQLKQQIMSQQGLEEVFPTWNRRNLTHLAKVILDKVVYLQDRNILFGLVNPSAIFVKDENHVYFAEMDTYQVEGYPILSYERVMQAPELQDVENGMRLYTKEQDNYEIALLVFMVLMPGKFPYNKGKNKNISESVKNMSFAFHYGKQSEEHGAREYFGLWRFAWSHLGNDLKQAFYYTFQNKQAFSAPENRRDARFWQKK